MRKITSKLLFSILITTSFLVDILHASSVTTTIPKNFYYHKNTLVKTVDRYTDKLESNNFTKYNWYPYFSSMIEHESCRTLTDAKCWSARAELNTKWPDGKQREQGIGFGQITRAFTQAGAIRLDVLNDLKKRYPSELKDLNWKNIKEKPDLQMRAILLLWTSNYQLLSDDIDTLDRVAMADSAYNGGYGYLLKDRKVCGLKANCNPNLWFNHVETINNRGNKILYANRTANEINRHHVRDVILNRMSKYYTIDWD